MDKKVIYLICGVSGAGKTYVCRNLSHKFNYIPHDEYIGKDFIGALKSVADDRHIITECPFAERVLRAELEDAGFEVRPYFVYEPTAVIISRFLSRERKQPSKSVLTRSVTIKTRIDEWQAPHGSSQELLAMLKNI